MNAPTGDEAGQHGFASRCTWQRADRLLLFEMKHSVPVTGLLSKNCFIHHSNLQYVTLLVTERGSWGKAWAPRRTVQAASRATYGFVPPPFEDADRRGHQLVKATRHGIAEFGGHGYEGRLNPDRNSVEGQCAA